MKHITTNLITLSLFFLASFLLNAQQINVDRPTNVIINDIQTNMLKFKEDSDIDIEGSPYINESFELATISQHKEALYRLRYNGLNHEMEILKGNSNIDALDPKQDYEITFTATNKVYKTVSYVNESNIEKRRFLVVLTEDEKCSLYKEERVKFYEKVEATSTYGKEKAARYERLKDLYYVKINDKIKELSLKKKQLIELFPNNEKELKHYLKEQKLNPKNEEDLIKIIEYINSILEG